MRKAKSNAGNVLVQIIIMIVLSVIIVLEIRTGFKMLYNREMESVNTFSQMAANAGKTKISIDTIFPYDLVPFDYMDGDVIEVPSGIKGGKIKLKISGALTDDSYADYGYYYYSDPNNVSATLTVMSNDMTDEVTKTLHSFWYGDTTNLYKAMTGGDVTANALNYYKCSHSAGDVPIMYDATAKLYYMLVPGVKTYTVIQAPNPFILSDDKVTVHFGDPSIDFQTEHTYSEYETLAAENTIRELSEEGADGDEDVEVDNPYVTDDDNSSTTYTSDKDDKRREQMVQLANYQWDVNGKCRETTMSVDITSQNSLASQWVLTATAYTYETNGIKISNLTANRSTSEFKIGGNLNNTLTTERPYVMLLKFIDNKGQLVGIKVLDYRETKIAPEGVANFSTVIQSNEMAIANITSVMFEIY